MRNSTTAGLVNIAGLIFDIVGVVILFYERDAGLKKISKIIANYSISYKESIMPIVTSTVRFGNIQKERLEMEMKNNIKEIIDDINYGVNKAIDEVNESVKELNEIIDAVEANNKKRQEKSQLWLWFIIIGFVLQSVAVSLNIVF